MNTPGRTGNPGKWSWRYSSASVTFLTATAEVSLRLRKRSTRRKCMGAR